MQQFLQLYEKIAQNALAILHNSFVDFLLNIKNGAKCSI
jgi:hypothetical protein